MPRRARHEARDRYHERRRDVRRRFREEFVKKFRERFRKRFHDSIRRYEDEFSRIKERLTLLRDIVLSRAQVVFKVEHIYFFGRKIETWAYDKILLDMPKDIRDEIVAFLRSVTVSKGFDPRILEQNPIYRYFLWFYIMYYSKYPCKHSAFAIKITPVIINYFGGVRAVYYVLRWAYAKDVKADPYLGRTRVVDFNITFMRYKYDDDLFNSLLYGDEGAMSPDDLVTVLRNARRESEVRIPLRRAMYQPHWIRYYFAKMFGMPEKATVVNHCSVYGILERTPKTPKLYTLKDRRMLGVRPRHRIKEILYRRGFRI